MTSSVTRAVLLPRPFSHLDQTYKAPTCNSNADLHQRDERQKDAKARAMRWMCLKSSRSSALGSARMLIDVAVSRAD